MSGLSIREFLGHKSREGGGKNTYLSSSEWKKKGHVVTWLHPQAKILALWRHNFQKIATIERDGDKRQEVWSDRLLCFEEEDVLRRQNYRDKETGERESPPERCPICLFVEHVRVMVENDELSWLDPVFTFHGSDDKKTVLFAGGLYNAFSGRGVDHGKFEKGKQGLTDAEKKAMKAKGVFASEAFKQVITPKLEYALAVVDDGDPKKGVQISIESQLLGDKVKSVIAKSMEEFGEEDGNPMLHPYAIKWEYHEDEAEFGKKYDATRLSRVALRPEVKALLEKDPPDMSNLAQRFNAKTMMARMQKHIAPALLDKIPWSEIFGHVTEADYAEEEQPKASPPRSSGASGGSTSSGRRQPLVPLPPSAPKAPPKSEPVIVDGEEVVACDKCEKSMKISAAECPHCGQTYEVDAPAPAPAPKLPTRAEVKARQQAAAGGRSATPPVPKSEPTGFSEDDDSIPFVRDMTIARDSRA